ncbi:MAG: DUF732 domain-containing protein [Mycobacterium sp.]|uniref:DUF732 domain-containing protein n=1 Tax=Mycobacterium sp. TaxID=1785 RepID=UPI003F958CAD
MPFGSGKRWFCAGFLCAAALVSIVSMAPASADQLDDAFVAALAKGGITMPDPTTSVAMAHTVCAGLDANQSTSVLP